MALKEERQAAALREDDDDSLTSPGPEGAVRDNGRHASGGGGQHYSLMSLYTMISVYQGMLSFAEHMISSTISVYGVPRYDLIFSIYDIMLT
jgi:hypothetical protein